MRNSGLLERASALRRQHRVSSRNAPELAGARRPAAPKPAEREGEEGISEDDRAEILAAIEGVSRGNRISAGSELMILHPRRKGFVFPLAVNVIAAILTVGGLLGLSLFFGRSRAGVQEGQGVVASAEGKLIQEIKKESESKLLEKDKAIADIQGRLMTIDKQRSDLASSLEDRVKAKEAELKASMQVELDKERKRLTALGLSEDAIKQRLKAFEDQKNAEFNRELAAFQKQVDAEKAAKDAELAGLRDEYQKNISSLGDERKKIQDEASAREQTLRSTLDAKTKELETQTAAAKAGMDKAKADLAQLQDQKARAQSAEDRILGLYGTIRAALRDRRFEDAAAGTAALVSYLNDPTVVSAPSIQGRREADLFIADALGSLARGEVAKASEDSSLLLRQSELLASVRDSVATAGKALRAGDTATAQAKYNQALAAVPEILAAHSYFIDKARDEETLRVAKLNDSLAAGDRSYKAGDLAGASARYSEALSYLPIDERARSSIAQRFAQAGAAEADKARRAADTKAAADPAAAARRDLAAGHWQQAIAGYLGVISAYPAADQTAESVKGIESARAGMVKDSDSRTAADAKTIADLKAATDVSAADLRTGLADLQKRYDASLARAAQLEKDLATARSDTAKAAAEAASTSQAAAAAAQAGDIAALKKEVDRLKGVETAYNQVIDAYSSYSSSEDQARKGADAGAAIAAKASLDAFLDNPATQAAFPRMGERVGRLLQDYQKSLSSETLLSAAEIAIEATRLKTPKEKQDYLDAQATRYATANPQLKDFIDKFKTVQ